MTNGIAVGIGRDFGSFDIWYNETCSSGYKHGKESLILIFKAYHSNSLRSSLWNEWSPKYKLAVPEQLVWWEDE